MSIELIRIYERFLKNIDRSGSLLYLARHSPQSNELPKSVTSDVLRAGVVFLHSSLEDFLRSVSRVRLRSGSAESLASIPLVGMTEAGRPVKFSMENLAAHRGKTIDQVIQESVDDALGKKSYNSNEDIAKQLKHIGVDVGLFEEFLPTLGSMIARRHRIVHNADLNEAGKSAEWSADALKELLAWTLAVTAFAGTLIQHLVPEVSFDDDPKFKEYGRYRWDDWIRTGRPYPPARTTTHVHEDDYV